MLKAFFDESGTQAGADVLSIGGYIAHDDSWPTFTAEWQQAMADYGIDYFHMTDFENRRKQFKGWPEGKRIPRLNRLMTIINRHTLASAGISVDLAAYERILTQEMKERIRGPYGLALKSCLASLKRLSKNSNMTEPMSITFDFGADQAGAIERETVRVITESEDESRYFSVRFERERHTAPMQAADIAVYDMRKEVARILGHHERQKRALMGRLNERYLYWGYMDEDELTRFVARNAERFAEPPRS